MIIMFSHAKVLILIAIASAIFINLCFGECNSYRWFGASSCKYQCHCDDFKNCDRVTGLCSDRCELGWFGPSCQYSAAEFSPLPGGPDLTWLSDRDENTCNDRDDQSITVKLNIPQRFTWLRVMGSDAALLRTLQLGYRTDTEPNTNRTCGSALTARVDDKTVDIACLMSDLVRYITLSGSGVKDLCSLYISYGRNVALRSGVRQSSTFGTWYARNAVDGDVGTIDGSDSQLRSTCTHTDSRNSNGWWSVTFSAAIQLSEVIIYNRRNPARDGCCEYRLIGFTLQAFRDNDEENEVFSYTDPRQDYRNVYYVTPSPGLIEPVKKIKITKSSDSNILTLCEVIVFGDSACPTGTFGRECERQCNCVGDQEACFVSTGGCPSGCAPGYTGEDCWTLCADGTYGYQCQGTCSEHCDELGDYCNYVNGSCLYGCEPGYQPPLCQDACAATKFGQDCSESCSTQCLDRVCHHVRGVCKACVPGYIGDFCEDECPVSKFGDNCSRNCSMNCLSEMCDHVTGKCNNCTLGKKGDYCETPIVQAQTRGGADDGAIIGAAVGVTLAVIVIITLIIMALVWRSRSRRGESEPFEMKQAVNQGFVDTAKSPTSFGKPPRPDRPKGDAADSTVNIAADGPDSVYTNVLPTNTAVCVEDLKTYLHQHSTDSFLKDQFNSVPMANSYPQKVGLTPPNNKKNRYKNIVPYDHSRVQLQANPYKKQDDYINASYVKGYANQETYIASQAPNDLILQDFVRMLWEKEVDRVVMLTNLIEMRKTKCTQYWPQENEQTFGEIKMELLTTRVFAEYTIRQIRLHKSGESSRDLTQFHFTAWPDKSVPDSPWGLVDFFHRVSAAPGSGSLLVHCSAGVGRTGTFIGLCHLLQEAEATGKMDFLATLWRLRQDRMSMIQTEDQYVFLHWAALVGHATVGTTVPAEDIADKLQDLDSRGFKQEFDMVGKACVHDAAEPAVLPEETEDVYQNSRAATNKQKNRLSNILPKDAYRPELTCEIKTMGRYINAVFVPTLTKDRQDILTQLPLPSTVTDFWRLVSQYHVGLIVAFEADSKNTDDTIGEFLPASETEPMKGALFEVQARSQGENHLWKELLVTVFKKRRSLLGSTAEQHHVTCLMCKDSKPTPETVVGYLRKIKSCRPGESLRTLYMCRNGAKLCGLMCIQSVLADRMETDQCLAVPLVVGAIRAIRPQVIPTVDQYKCLYDVLKLIQDSSSVYGNVGDSAKSTTPSESTNQNKPSSNGNADIPNELHRQASRDSESLRDSGRSSSRSRSPAHKPSPGQISKKTTTNGVVGSDTVDAVARAGHGGGVRDAFGVSILEEAAGVEYANMQ